MQIVAPSPAPIQSPLLSNGGGEAATARRPQDSVPPVSVEDAEKKLSLGTRYGGGSDVISISAEAQVRNEESSLAPIYAEIWKGAVKVAQVDIYGRVVSYSGLVSSGGGGVAGPLQAAQRAIQVARQTGGEIRTAGQVVDRQTLAMRARLEQTYL